MLATATPVGGTLSWHSMLERALDLLPDGILLTGPDRGVLYSNAAFRRHWQIPDCMMAVGSATLLLEFVKGQLIDPAAFVREVERITPTRETSQDEVCLKDGRVLSRRSMPFEENGAFAARLWIFTDVTDARHARIDALCGIPNRRAFATEYPSFVANDDGRPRSVGLIDIDNFKAYNDRYGHAAGDIVLQRVGALLRDRTSDGDDRVFRIGGEEFLVASRMPLERDAPALFEGIRDAVTGLGLTHDGNAPHGKVTVSIGFCAFRGPQDAQALFDRADAALYRAKHRGRNRIEAAETARAG